MTVSGAPSGAPAAARRFLCDAMFARLGRWLRVAGYDTRIALGGETDRMLVLVAGREGRLLLTRDREILTIRNAPATTLVLPHGDVDACAAELARRLGLDWRRDPFSRCVVCNAPLQPAGPELGARFVEASLNGRRAVNACPSCGRLYWEGDHVRRMRARLERWAAGADEAGS